MLSISHSCQCALSRLDWNFCFSLYAVSDSCVNLTLHECVLLFFSYVSFSFILILFSYHSIALVHTTSDFASASATELANQIWRAAVTATTTTIYIYICKKKLLANCGCTVDYFSNFVDEFFDDKSPTNHTIIELNRFQNIRMP